MNSIPYLQKRKENIEKVVIVYPYTYINPYFALPPIAAEYLQAGVVHTGREALLLDMRYETEIKEHLESADLVCVYGYFEDCSLFGRWNIHVIPEVLAQIPPDTPVLAGGTGFSDPDRAFGLYPNIDLIIRGNPETPVIQLLEGKDLESINNLAYRQNGGIVRTERAVHALPEDIYPRRDLRNASYNYHVVGIKVDLIRAGVGCNYHCKFCYQYGKDFDGKYRRWQGRSAQSLYNELTETEAPIIGWVDDDMTAGIKYLEELADLLMQNDVHKLYAGTGRIDHVLRSDVEVLKRLEESGLIALSFGVESLKQETLRFYGKGQTVADVERAMRMMQNTNILLICNFIFGSPGETEQDMMDMLWFGRRWNVDTLVTNRLSVPEHSAMYDMIHDAETGRVKPGMERIEGEELARIKYRVKFAQRAPLRTLLSLLKLYRHRGMFMDPLYAVCCAFETFTRYTWLEKTKVFPLALRAVKKLTSFALFRQTTRLIAILVTPPVRAANWLFERIDRPLGISTTLLPKFFLFLQDGMYRRQCLQVQTRTEKVPGS